MAILFCDVARCTQADLFLNCVQNDASGVNQADKFHANRVGKLNLFAYFLFDLAEDLLWPVSDENKWQQFLQTNKKDVQLQLHTKP